MTINTGQIIQRPTTTVDGNFFIPPGVVDLRYKTEEEIRAEDANNDDPSPENSTPESAPEFEVVDVSAAPFAEGTGTPPANPEIPAPDWLTVVSQTVKFSNDGTSLVDVIIEVQDIPGVSLIDVAVTKT
jgi:hypothetical protein